MKKMTLEEAREIASFVCSNCKYRQDLADQSLLLLAVQCSRCRLLTDLALATEREPWEVVP